MSGSLPLAPPPPRAHSWGTHVRATVVFVALTTLLAGFAYPGAVVGFAQLVDPGSANGSLLHDANGTVVGSSLVGQNLTAFPYLFWERPSLTDYNLFNGSGTPPGASDPALVNETLYFLRLYGNGTVNGSIPDWLVTPSGSSVDPDLTPGSVLVQIPRVAGASHLTVSFLLDFVNARIQSPMVPFVGVPYVDVLELDVDLLGVLGR